MNRSLNALRTNLKEITPMIEKLSSEAVQLRVLDIVERLLSAEMPSQAGNTNVPRRRGRPPASNKTAAPKGGTKRGRPSKTRKTRRGNYGQGPSLVLNSLLENGFFTKPRAISDILDAAQIQYGRTYTQPEISGRMLKLTQLKKLKRTKNTNGRFVYQTR